MKDLLTQITHIFLKRELDPRSPVLLALSGGPDSLSLFHLLRCCQKITPFTFAIAHVDHGWRSESSQEAVTLKSLAEREGIVFHDKKLSPETLTGNLEEECRRERLTFFKELCKEHGYQAVIMGHHRDDQAETVLKRLFEGAPLTSCAAMQGVAKNNDLTIWRPLLTVAKGDILDWLQKQGIDYFVDETNRDKRFLRGRMREEMIPALEKQFGKNISKNLAFISDQITRLNDSLEGRLEDLWCKRVVSSFGVWIKTKGEGLSCFELEALVRRLCREEGLSLSREVVLRLARDLLEGRTDCSYPIGGRAIHVDRHSLFLLTTIPNIESDQMSLVEGVYSFGSWSVSVKCTEEELDQTSDWQDLWAGGGEVVLPHGNYTLGAMTLKEPYPRSKAIRNFLSEHRVPSFMRGFVPVIKEEGVIVHEFLTGEQTRKSPSNLQRLKVKIQIH